MGENKDGAGWSPAGRCAFRFLFAYLVLYNLPFPVNAVPYGPLVTRWYTELWNAVVPWVGRTVFHATVSVRPNGSGDTTYNYVQVFCFLVLAAAVAAVWSLLDRRRTNYAALHRGLRVYVRYSLAVAMISYGAVKVIKNQFPAPSPDRLLEPFGEASPMGLLWAFMGASESYTVFGGLCELVGGLLLTTRRTTLLGALVCAAVLGNIVMLNFSYDVPVKLYSCHLLLMALFLIAPDARRLADLLLFNRGTTPAELRPPLRHKWLGHGAVALRTLVVVGFTGLALFGAYQGRRAYGDLAPRPPLYGIWEVETFTLDGRELPPLVTDGTRWRRLAFGRMSTAVSVQGMSGARRYYAMKLDPGAHTLALTKYEDPAWKTSVSYEEAEPGHLALEGTLGGKPFRAKLRRVDESQFLLVNRGFHWINEYPFNR